MGFARTTLAVAVGVILAQATVGLAVVYFLFILSVEYRQEVPSGFFVAVMVVAASWFFLLIAAILSMLNTDADSS